MDKILELHCETGNFSHGYLFIGDKKEARDSASKIATILLECSESSLFSHPDFLEISLDYFEEKEVGEIKNQFSTKPIIGDRKIFFFDIPNFSNELTLFFSQIIEKCPENYYLFFLNEFIDEVPLILRPKLTNISLIKKDLDNDKKNFYEKFLKSDSIERLNLIKNIVNDKKRAVAFLNELEFLLEKKIKKEENTEILQEITMFLEELKDGRQLLSSRFSYPKIIIEHLTLTLPRIR